MYKIQYEFDPQKNETNIEKHGIDLSDVPPFFDAVYMEHEDRRKNYGETRMVATGVIEGIVLVVVYTDRTPNIRRLISARKAKQRERQAFENWKDELGESSSDDG